MMSATSRTRSRIVGLNLLLVLLPVAWGSASCATASFSSYAQGYAALPEPKAMVCAFGNAGDWACGTGSGSDVIQAEAAAQTHCEDGRRRYRIAGACLLTRINDLEAVQSERGPRLRFRYYVREYNRASEPKVMACAYDNDVDWVCSIVTLGPGLEQIKSRALELCASARAEKWLLAECELMAANTTISTMPWQTRRVAESTIVPKPAVDPKPLPEQFATTTGTCFAVSADGRLVTADHVVDGAHQIEISFDGREWHPARVEVRSEALDVAVLKAEVEVSQWVSLSAGDVVGVGDDVFTFGFPVIELLGMEPKYTSGSISALSGFQGDYGFMQVTVPVQPGNSGGPLFDFNGQVVGVVVSKAAALAFLSETGALPENISWAVKSAMVQPLVGVSDMPPPISSRREIIERAQRSVCIVKSVSLVPPS